jgi:putative oxidoreductase
MLASWKNPLSLVGRVLMSWLFIPAGFGKIAGFAGAVGYASSVGMPMAQVAVGVGLLIELLGGIALLVGFGTRWAALLLAVFTAVASFFFHNYWTLPVDQQMMQQLMFNKNIAVVGGLLAFAAFGAGAWSVDGQRKSD